MSTKKYDVEFKKMVVELHINGTGVTELSKEYQIAPTTLYKWIDLYRSTPESSATEADLLALKKEMARINEENDLLKKAISILSQRSNNQ